MRNKQAYKTQNNIALYMLKAQVLENASMEMGSVKLRDFLRMENATTANASVNLQGWKM